MRTISDRDKQTWSCEQVSGDKRGDVRVLCRSDEDSVMVDLRPDWELDMSDADVLTLIFAARREEALSRRRDLDDELGDVRSSNAAEWGDVRLKS